MAQLKVLRNIILNFFPSAIELDKSEPDEQGELKYQIYQFPYNTKDMSFLLRTVTANVATTYQQGNEIQKFKLYSEERGDHWAYTMNLYLYFTTDSIN